MRLAVLALALLPTAALAQQQGAAPVVKAAAPAQQCQNAKSQHVERAPATVRGRPLASEPLANVYLGVVRKLDGCDVPVKIREDVGR